MSSKPVDFLEEVIHPYSGNATNHYRCPMCARRRTYHWEDESHLHTTAIRVADERGRETTLCARHAAFECSGSSDDKSIEAVTVAAKVAAEAPITRKSLRKLISENLAISIDHGMRDNGSMDDPTPTVEIVVTLFGEVINTDEMSA